MAAFPLAIDGKSITVRHARRYPSKALAFLNDSEQRFASGAVVNRWQLDCNGISAADRNTLQTFFESVKGAFDATWDFTFLGTTYLHCGFEDDVLEWTESKPNRWSTSLRIRQVRKT